MLTLANRITMGRIVLIPFFTASVLYGNSVAALIIFVIAMISDAADGFIARALGQKTVLGRMLDPVADKFLVISAFVCMTVSSQGRPGYGLPLYVPIAVISRDIIIMVGSMLIYMVSGSLDVRPTYLGKLTTFLQMSVIVLLLIKFKHVMAVADIMVFFTVVSGIDYLVKGSRMFNAQGAK